MLKSQRWRRAVTLAALAVALITVLPSLPSLALAAPSRSAAPLPNLPSPPWWKDANGQPTVCDAYHYAQSPQNPSHVASYSLGVSYRGVVACGPRPLWDASAPKEDPEVHFFPGAWGEYEWECTELVFRYLYLAYGQKPYKANGGQVVANYATYGNGRLKIIHNGTANEAPAPGDVISFDSPDGFGHTAIVTESTIGASGSGSITILQQNAWGSFSPTQILAVKGWTVSGVGAKYPATGWLHDPSAPVAPPTAPLPYVAHWSQGMDGWTGTADWRISNGMLVNDGTNSDDLETSPTLTGPLTLSQYPNYTLTASIAVIHQGFDPGFGMFIRYTAPDQGYIVGLNDGYNAGNPDMRDICVTRADSFYAPITNVPFTPDSRFHTYRIQVLGGKIVVSVDGVTYATVTDSAYASGASIGLWDKDVQLQVRSLAVVAN